jgi:enamine deaminase RidA (YjgF/YER057c/UK114 family)
MRKRIFNWQGQRFAYLWLEAEGGQPLERQSEALFSRAAAELDALGLSIARNVVRTRLFGRTRQARDVLSAVRTKALIGQGRAAGSSYISSSHLRSAADVALDLFGMTPPAGAAMRTVTEHEPMQNFIRHLVWGPMVFLAGMTCADFPTVPEQVADILPRAGALLQETGCGWSNVVRVSCFLHKDQDPDALLSAIGKTAPVPLDDAEIEFVEGYSQPGKLIEVEITAKR